MDWTDHAVIGIYVFLIVIAIAVHHHGGWSVIFG